MSEARADMRAQALPASSEQGMTLIEVLVAILLIGIVSMAVAVNTINALSVAKKTHINYLASNLALSKVEQLAAYEASQLSALSTTETHLTTAGTDLTFKRTTTIVKNSDNSRTITVRVDSESAAVPTHVTFTSTLSVWN
jgi:prepilin-type N-terminal cleavage/methylation domain-containing protein